MNIDMIEIMENDIKLVIFPKKEKVLIDNKYYHIEKEKIEEFIRIIRTWDNEYGTLENLDGNYFEINVYYDGKIDKMCGKRGMPSNYLEFADFVRSIYVRD